MVLPPGGEWLIRGKNGSSTSKREAVAAVQAEEAGSLDGVHAREVKGSDRSQYF